MQVKKLPIKILSALFPNFMANYAYYKFANPQVKKLRSNETETLNLAKKKIIKFKGFDIQTYTWQGGPEQILLIHGWEGQAGNFADVVLRLIAENYTVFAFDGPSHGASSRGHTNPIEFSELVGILIKKTGITKLISHSFGGVATTFALYNDLNLKIDKYVLLTTPDKFLERIEDVSSQVGITNKVKNKLIKRLENDTLLDVRNLGVSTFVNSINVASAMIIHDKNDSVIPIERSRNVYNNWKTCEFVEVEGTGHFRILRTKSVLDTTLKFLRN